MSSIVLDTSALLATIQNEPGGEALLDDSVDWILSSVNFAEAMGVLIRKGFTRREARDSIHAFDVRIVDFDSALAEETGALIVSTREAGLSLGDRACLALAARENVPVLTADRSWRRIQTGLTIQCIR
jgi:ribonuclease VapC